MVEAVVTQGSPLIGNSASQMSLRERFGVNLLALSRRGRQVSQRLRRVRFQQGDLLVLHGNKDAMPDTLAELGCLPLAERNVGWGGSGTSICRSPCSPSPWCWWRSRW